MDKKKVYITRRIPDEAIKVLEKHFDVEINPRDRVLFKGELLEKVKGRDAVLCLLSDNIDKEVLEAAGDKCKIFANYGATSSNIDLVAATQSGVIITIPLRCLTMLLQILHGHYLWWYLEES